MNKALSGIRVLDFTQVLAGPFCTMNLADLAPKSLKSRSLEQVMEAGSLARLSTDRADIIPW